MKKNLLVLLVCLIFCGQILGQGVWVTYSEFKVDGIGYSIMRDRDDEVQVAYDYDGYTGDIIIPESVTFEEKTYRVTRIGNGAFFQSKINKIVLPQSVKGIGHRAFENSSLSEIILPNDGVTSVDIYAFDATSLKEITLPNSLVHFIFSPGYHYFLSSNLLSINVDVDNPKFSSLDGVLFNKDQTTLFYFPEGRTGEYIIPDGIAIISANCFMNSKLTAVTIPKSVNFIDNDGFGCFYLKEVRIKWKNPSEVEIYSYSFYPITYTDAILYVPTGTKSLYEVADIWKDFKTIIEEEPEIINVEGVTISESSLQLKVGETTTLTATISPKNASNQNITWNSSNETVASVSEEGVVSALKSGEATITVTTEDGEYTASCEVNVISAMISVTGIALDKTSMELMEGATEQLTATISPEDATNQNVIWSSSDESIAIVSPNGLVGALKPGKATITATTEDGEYTASCEVNVISATISVTGIALDKTSLELEEGETVTLTATISPEDATNQNVIWSSSDETVAIVSSDGFVGALKPGKATITATTEDGEYTASCEVNVISATILVTGVTLSKTILTLDKGETETLAAIITPENASNKNVKWKSSDETVVIVTSNGLIGGLKIGNAIITVTTEDGGYTANCEVTVKEKPAIEIDENEPAGENGQGSIDVSFNIPTDVPFEGNFTITLPEGFSLNLDLTSLAAGLGTDYILTITPLANNQWQLSIAPKSLRADNNSSYQQLVNLVYDIEENVSDGTYQALISDLNFEFEDGSTISKETIDVNITVDHSYVGIQKVDFTANVYYHDGILYVDTPAKEQVSVYSVSGNLLYQFEKQAGKTSRSIGSIPAQILIVKGSSGWNKKVAIF